MLCSALSLVLVAACGGGGPPSQTTTPRQELTGVATDGTTPQLSVVASGVAGLQRSVLVFSGRYTASLTQLTGPYYLINTPSPGGDPGFIVMTSVATRPGTANVTPLTTLLAAQVLGLDSANAFRSFAEPSTPSYLITEANIQAAQAKLTKFLQAYGVQVSPGIGSFTESPFNPVAGDPMYDTILALTAKIAQNGTTLDALTTQVANAARFCIAESITVTVNGEVGDFCPRVKTALPDAGDSTITDYVFTTITNDSLTVKVRVNDVLGIDYVTAGGDTFSCTASACGNIQLGALTPDQKRSITFGRSQVTGSAGSAIFDGTLIGGNFPPPLNCLDNRFFLTLPDTSIVADCVSTDTGPVAISGTRSEMAGLTRDKYHFANDGSTPQPPQTASPEVNVVLDSNSSIVSIAFKQRDPNTGEVVDNFACQFAACNGVTLGPITVQTKFGLDFLVRNITMNGTILSGINPDSTLTGTTATLDASFTLVYFRDPNLPAHYPVPVSCSPGFVSIMMTAAPGATFNACYQPPLLIQDLGGGDSLIAFRNFNAIDQVQIDLTLHNGVPASISANVQGTGETFACSTDCTGVVLSVPDSNGALTVTFSGTVLHLVQSFPLPGNITLTLNGGPIAASPPQPVVCDPTIEDRIVADLDGGSVNMCFTPPGIIYDLGGGDGEPNFTSSAGDNIDMVVHANGDFDYVFVTVASSPFTAGGTFICFPPDCAGVTISPPDVNGARSVAFSGTVLTDFNDPSSGRTLTITGGPTVATP
ncbi:MAG TPA: hypothetical protein VHB46_12380 [Burkholderiales bacterium]|nr:hypothetical protein [Burkholderiales bacterium]